MQLKLYVMLKFLNEDETTQTALQKLFGEIAERYTERQGGYTESLNKALVAVTVLNQ